MAFDREEYTGNALWFLAGAAIGATLALLFAPAPGHVTRRKIRHAGRKGLLAAERVGEDLAEKGREVYEKGKQLADEAAELFERGKKLVEG